MLSRQAEQMSRINKMSDRRNKPNDRHEPSQLENRNFTPMMKSLYLKEDSADAFFLFAKSDDETERVPTHKLLLSTSEKFAKLFADAEDGQNEFKIDDTTVEAFKEFLQFFYMPKLKFTFENIAAILALAKDYGNEEMVCECSVYLTHRLTTENIIWGYGLAIRFDRVILKKSCEQKIAENAGEVFKSNCFLECEREVLNQILQLDSLKCDESQVLAGCLSWAKAIAERKSLDSNNTQVLREELGDLLYQIRFKSITIENLAMIIGSFKGFFSITDLQEITQLIGLKDYKSETFISKGRSFMGGSHSNININNNISGGGGGGGGGGIGVNGDERFRNDFLYGNRILGNSQTRYLIQKEEKTRFEAQRALRLVGINFSLVHNVKNDMKVNVDAKLTINEEVVNGKKPAEIYQSKITLSSENSAFVSFCCPISIEPLRKYDILLDLDTTNELYNQFDLKSFIELKNGTKVRFLPDETKGYDDSKVGMVTKLQFKRP